MYPSSLFCQHKKRTKQQINDQEKERKQKDKNERKKEIMEERDTKNLKAFFF